MSEDSNTCKVCGGLLRFEWTVAFEQCRPHAMRVEPAISYPLKFCSGHDYDPFRLHHNGSLDERDTGDAFHVYVEMREDYERCDGSQVVVVRGGQGARGIELEPRQALSLLVWLLQEREKLEGLAGGEH